jgi:hypothetical protein
MREMKAPLRGLLAVRCLAVAAHGCGRAYRRRRAWAGLALAGLAVEILVFVPPSAGLSQFSPDVPGMIEGRVMRPPQIRVFGSSESSLASLPAARPMAVKGPQVSPPHANLARDDGDLDDDDPSSLPVLTRGVRYLPLPSARMSVSRATSAFPWPFPYPVRPQLLTRS